METLLNNLQERLEDARDEAIYSQTKDFHIRLEIPEIKALISLLKGGWVKCEDSLPPTNDTVLLYRSNKPYYLGRFHEGKWQIQGCTSNSQCTPSRWAPLLPKPTE